MKILVDSVAWFPKSSVNLEELKHNLTVKYFKMGEKEPIYVPAYEETKKYILVPRDYGLHLISEMGYTADKRFSAGYPARFPKQVKHTGEFAYQAPIVEDMVRLAATRHDFIVEAATGKGKTVMSLSVAQKLGRTTLVIVDQENLMLQWIAQCKTVLGLRPQQIGIIQGETCDYRGKAVVIAMVHSLVQRDYEEDMYSYFGTVIFDEVHGLGAPTFSAALRMFDAQNRFGVSATVDRSDALQRILHWNLGGVDIELSDKHDKSYLYYIESNSVYTWYANISPKSGRILMEVSEDTNRNCMLAEAICWMHEEGREALAISDRIEQLEALMAMCYFLGMPDSSMGLYTGMRNSWGYQKNPVPKRRPYGYATGTDYTPVILLPKRKKIPKAELARVKADSQHIYATYGMFSKGVDVPRLNGGIDCTPRAKAAQTHGRILRKKAGKLVPLWITVSDRNSYRLQYQFLQRLEDYINDSAEIYKWRMDKGVRLADVKELKRGVRARVKMLRGLDIVTDAAGISTLQTPSTPSVSAAPRSTRTARNTRYP